MMAPRLSTRSPHESSDLLVMTLMVCREKRAEVRIMTSGPMNQRSHCRCTVLTKPVVDTIINHAVFALLNVVTATYIPLVRSTPVEFNGLTPIDLRLYMYGVMNGIFQFAFFSHLRRFGARNVFISTVLACAVIYIISPFENLDVRVDNSSMVVLWLLVILQLSALFLSEMGYGKYFAPFSHAGAHVGSPRRSYYILYTFSLPFPTNDRSARRIVWRRWRRRFGARWPSCCGLAICVLPDA